MDPPAPDAADVPGETVDVWGRGAIVEAWRAIDAAMAGSGYHRGRRVKDGWLYRSEITWKPDVVVHDDGWFDIHRRPPGVQGVADTWRDMTEGAKATAVFAEGGPHTEADVAMLGEWGGDAQVCAFGPFCLSVAGWFVDRAGIERMKSELSAELHEPVAALRDAVADTATMQRVNVDIPTELDAIWADPGLTPVERRRRIYSFWDTRTPTPEGDAARRAVEAFIRGVVQASDDPFGTGELDALNALRVGERALAL